MSDTRATTRQPAAVRRREREREILRATRELFDETGVRDAQIEDIARAVGVNRAIIYRHFSGKEELFALTLVSYLEDLETRLAAAARSKRAPMSRLVAVTEAFVDFGLETHTEGHVVHVRPELVVEIAFDGVQTSSRYPGGVALRFARVKGYREDKSAAEADTIASVRAIHAAQAAQGER